MTLGNFINIDAKLKNPQFSHQRVQKFIEPLTITPTQDG